MEALLPLQKEVTFLDRRCSPSTPFSTRCSMEGFTHTRPCTLLSEGQHCFRSTCVTAWEVLTDAVFVAGTSGMIICTTRLLNWPASLPQGNSGPAQIQPLGGHCCPVLLARTECLNDLGMLCSSPAEGKLRFCSEYLSAQDAC